jgi:hypothetical protein
MPQDDHPPDLDSLDAGAIVGRRFGVWRTRDITGVSGTGWVMAGCVLPDGQVVTQWVNSPLGITTVTIWPGLEGVLAIHGHSGSTELIWLDGEQTLSG